MIAALISLLGSSAVGTILGGIFAFLNKKSDLEVKKLDLDHEKAKWGHELLLRNKDIELATAEAQGRKEVAIIEGDSQVEAARMQAIAVVQESDKISADEIKAAGKLGWLYVIAAVFNKLIRPVATVILTYAAISLNWVIFGRLTENWAMLTDVQQFEISMQALAWVTGQGSAVISYWFVSRGSSK